MSWLSQGYENIWLPYTQMQWGKIPLAVKAAEGSTIILEDDTKLIDGTSSWWSACFGYNHPKLVAAAQKQAQQLSHVMFAGLANEPAYKLATRLSKITGLERCFFSDSGSTAVEVTMKMAVQYWLNKGDTNKTKFICFKNGYHGDTMGAMSVADPEKGMHSIFKGYMPQQICVDIPKEENTIQEFDKILRDNNHQIAGVIIEPLMQGAGGMKFHSTDVLEKIYKLTKKHNLLFIADEIATGFGRTGHMFACQEAGFTPDIMCLGKALTGGMLTLSATMANEDVFNAFKDEELTKCFMHGPTYMGNALACSVANAVLDIFEEDSVLDKIQQIEGQIYKELEPCKQLDIVRDVRVKGAVGVVELKKSDLFFSLREKFIKQGIWLRPFGNIVYITPPFVISESELTQITTAVYKILQNE